MAEIDLAAKNRLSHRAAAFRALVEALRAHGVEKSKKRAAPGDRFC